MSEREEEWYRSIDERLSEIEDRIGVLALAVTFAIAKLDGGPEADRIREFLRKIKADL